MSTVDEYFKERVYPGRVIIVGKSPQGDDVIMYAITGRSPSSQARMLEHNSDNGVVLVKPTDEEILKTGDPELLIYPAIYYKNGLVFGNGVQTKDIFEHYDSERHSVNVLLNGQSNWSYEPDAPNYTPRISGVITDNCSISILKRAVDSTTLRYFFQVSMIDGIGKLITTYNGYNESPLLSYNGEPTDVEIPWDNPEDCVKGLYKALGPSEGTDDYRVTAAALYRTSNKGISLKIINRCEL